MNSSSVLEKTRTFFQTTAIIPKKWKTILALILLFSINSPWILGLLFLYWAIHDTILGHTYIVESISRRENPFLFFLIILLWFVAALIYGSDAVSSFL